MKNHFFTRALACVLALVLVSGSFGAAAALSTPVALPNSVSATSVMSHADYMAAELDSEVTVLTYVQAHQSWWNDKVTVYAQSPDGAYFLYEMACSEEDEKLLVPGTPILVTGIKSEWSGEVEIVDATFQFIDTEPFVAEAVDLTNLFRSDSLKAHQNELVIFHDLTVAGVEFKNGEPGDDIYVTFTKDGSSMDFCVEYYLTGSDTPVYGDVSNLNVGDVVDVVCFLYWYNGPNPHILSVADPEVQALRFERYSGNLEIPAGRCTPLTLTGRIPAEKVQWISFDANVAFISNGTLYAVNPGTTTIRAEYKTLAVELQVTVK